jgi:hypothetical protein
MWRKHLPGALAAVALFCGIVAALAFAVVKIFDLAAPETSAAIVTVLGSVLVVAWTYSNEKNKSREEAHRQRKVEIYATFMNTLLGFFFSDQIQKMDLKTDFVTDERQVAANLCHLKRDVLLWSSPTVVQEFMNYFMSINVGAIREEDVAKEAAKIGKVIMAMRSDLGLSNKGLDQHAFIKIMIGNANELAKLRLDS